jgi:hypothetical protein
MALASACASCSFLCVTSSAVPLMMKIKSKQGQSLEKRLYWMWQECVPYNVLTYNFLILQWCKSNIHSVKNYI